MEFWRTVMYIVWSLVGVLTIGLSIYGVMFYRSFYKSLFKNDNNE
ncbi:MAG: hypothetical protein RBT15_04830 [Gudongella sp.]|jgi:hypothetical protein|nr:hypothetical protein [Gudongella sp.]